MEVAGIGGEGSSQRTGARVLSLLAAAPVTTILDRLSRGPMRLSELRRETGMPPQTALRAHLKELGEIGVIGRRRFNPFPSAREYELTSLPGRELLFVATIVEGWLASAPEDPVPIDGAGQAAIEALVGGWSSMTVHVLAAGPLTLSALERRIVSLDRATLERDVAAMQRTGLLERQADDGGETSYTVTEWLRMGLAPIAAAVRWERHHIPIETAPITPVDAEAGLVLAMPLLKLPPELSGTCRLTVEFGEGDGRRPAGVTVDVERGHVVSCATRLADSPAAWASGPPAAWLRNAIEADPNRLEIGGDQRLVRGLLDGLSQALFSPVRLRLPRP